jgi:hypothetical protein
VAATGVLEAPPSEKVKPPLMGAVAVLVEPEEDNGKEKAAPAPLLSNEKGTIGAAGAGGNKGALLVVADLGAAVEEEPNEKAGVELNGTLATVVVVVVVVAVVVVVGVSSGGMTPFSCSKVRKYCLRGSFLSVRVPANFFVML